MSSTLGLAVLLVATAANAGGQTRPPVSLPPVAVGPQYDTTHVYVAPEDFDRFVASLVATFGGTTSKRGVFTVTPTPRVRDEGIGEHRWWSLEELRATRERVAPSELAGILATVTP